MSYDTAIPFDPTTPEQRENPFDVLALARREQPVFYAPALDLWVVTRHDDVLAVLKDHRTFSSSGALKSSSAPLPREVLEVLAEGYPGMPYIIELDPPLHDRIRGLVARAFTPRRIDALAPRIEAIATELIDGFASDGRADVVEAFAWPLPLRVLGELFGFPRDDLEQIHRWGNDWLLLQQDRPTAELVEHARGLVELQRYCVAAVEERQRRPTDDLLGALVAYRIVYHCVYLRDVPFALATFSDGRQYEMAALDILAHPPLGSAPFYLQCFYAYFMALPMAIEP